MSLLQQLSVLLSLLGLFFVDELDSHRLLPVFLCNIHVIIELGDEVLLQQAQLVLIGLINAGDGDASGSLQSNEFSQNALALDDAVWGLGGSAKSWEEANELDWVDVSSDDDELGESLFDEGGDLVKAELEEVWLGSNVLLSFLSVLSELNESGFLGLFGLWGVLSEESVEFLAYCGLGGAPLVLTGSTPKDLAGILDCNRLQIFWIFNFLV